MQTGLIRAVQVARDVEERSSVNGLRFATFGETGVPAPDLQSMIEAVPPAITAALNADAVPSPTGRPWAKNMVRAVVLRRFPIGVTVGGVGHVSSEP